MPNCPHCRVAVGLFNAEQYRCPSCGRRYWRKKPKAPIVLAELSPNARPGPSRRVVPLAIVLGVGTLFVCIAAALSVKENPEARKRRIAEQQAELARQPDRLEIITKLQAADFVDKIDLRSSGTVEVWVGHMFHDAKFDQKEKFLGVIYAYEHTADPRREVLWIIDGMSGKEIGRYAPASGGLDLY